MLILQFKFNFKLMQPILLNNNIPAQRTKNVKAKELIRRALVSGLVDCIC